MQAFENAILAKNSFVETEVDYLDDLRTAIISVLILPTESQHMFDRYSLTPDILKHHLNHIESAISTSLAGNTLNSEDIDEIIPFISTLGQAYTQLMIQSLATHTHVSDPSIIEQAGTLHAVLNFFHAQKAKLYPDASNQPAFRNE